MASKRRNMFHKNKTQETTEKGTIEHDTKLALVNTLYFKESWMYPFSDFLTELRVFHTENGETKMVPMMTNVEYFKYANIPSLGLKAVKLPYKDYNKKLIIMKPYTHDGLPRLEQVLTYDHIRSEILDMMSYSALKVMIPKFSMDNSFSLKGVLKKMGLKKIFDASSADFSATVFGQGLEVTSIQHKVHLEVDENGTIASAATGIGASSRSTMVITDTFIADGPFLFAVCDKKTRGILFMGRYMGPP
ncbi:hypothetical protein AAG570_010603 [Ranatra chinensis]|uniref:Serpin domain-containing protein n=1 Tax=Ranatra chinensis TaxID=642074 RepID=A0ABD0YNH3_9HEMI